MTTSSLGLLAPPASLPAWASSMGLMSVHVPLLALDMGGIEVRPVPCLTWFSRESLMSLATAPCCVRAPHAAAELADANIASRAGLSLTCEHAWDDRRTVTIDVAAMTDAPPELAPVSRAEILRALLQATRRNLACFGPARLVLAGLERQPGLAAESWPGVLVPEAA